MSCGFNLAQEFKALTVSGLSRAGTSRVKSYGSGTWSFAGIRAQELLLLKLFEALGIM